MDHPSPGLCRVTYKGHPSVDISNRCYIHFIRLHITPFNGCVSEVAGGDRSGGVRGGGVRPCETNRIGGVECVFSLILCVAIQLL